MIGIEYVNFVIEFRMTEFCIKIFCLGEFDLKVGLFCHLNKSLQCL